MIITSIINQKGNKKRYNIYIDDNYYFSAEYEDLIEFGIKESQYINDEDLKKLMYKCQYKKAFNKAINLLARRYMSEYEVRSKLAKDSYDDGIIEIVINKLKELNYINDSEFSRHWVEDRKSLKPTGKKRIESELISKGVSKEIARNAVDESGCDDIQTAVYLIEKKLRSKKTISDETAAWGKLFRYLIYKGIGYETARKAIGRYLNIDSYNE